ncbi:hypothetical protein B7463_g1158, partial [Scytalidium lignicola]
MPEGDIPRKGAWDLARAQYLDRLSKHDRQQLEIATVDDVKQEILNLEKWYASKYRGKPIMKCLQILVVSLDSYGKAIDVFVNTSPLFLAPIWGTIRLLLQAVQNFSQYVDRLLDMLGEVGENLPRFIEYNNLFPGRSGVQSALVKVYVDTIDFCVKVRNVFLTQITPREPRDPSVKSFWKTFESEFGAMIQNFRKNRQYLESEVNAAGLQAAAEHYKNFEVEAGQARLLRETGETLHMLQRRKQLLLWIHATSNNERSFERARSLRHAGTCRWILDNNDFKCWFDSTYQTVGKLNMLWVTGIPGGGKTVLSGFMIDHLQTTTASKVAYFFCSRTDPTLIDSSSVCRVFVSQLLLSDPINGKIADILWDGYTQSSAEIASTEDLQRILQVVCKTHPSYFVVDGFDECIDKDSLVKSLTSLSILAKVAVFSRTRFPTNFEESTSYSIKITKEDVMADIASIVKSYFDSSKLISSLDLEFRQRLLTDITQKAEGMFLWHRLVLDQLDDHATYKELKRHMKALPVGISALYKSILENICPLRPMQKPWIMKILRWTVAAQRPLKLQEIAEAIILNQSSSQVSEDEKIISIETMIRQCHPLVEVDAENNTVKLCHYSFREYVLQLTDAEARNLDVLETSQHGVWANISEELGTLCLHYLTLQNVPLDCNPRDDSSLQQKFPLLQYAVVHWLDHMLEAPLSPSSLNTLYSFLGSQRAQIWLKSFIEFRRKELGSVNFGSTLVSIQSRIRKWATARCEHPCVKRLKLQINFLSGDIFGNLLEREVRLSRDRFGRFNPATFATEFALIDYYNWRGRTEIAEKMLESYLYGIPSGNLLTGTREDLQMLEKWLDLARFKAQNGRFADAKPICEVVYEIRMKVLGSDSFETWQAASFLADVYTNLEYLEDAENLYRVTLAGLIQCQGLSLDTLRVYNNLGNCLGFRGKLDEAEVCLSKAFEGRRSILGNKNQSTLCSLDCLGVIYRKLGKLEEAFRAHTEAFEGLRELVGEEHVLTWRAASNLAAVHCEADRYTDAMEYAVKAIVSMENIFGYEHIETLDVAPILANILRKTGDKRTAGQIIRNTALIAGTSLGKGHSIYKNCQEYLDTSYDVDTAGTGIELPILDLSRESFKGDTN